MPLPKEPVWERRKIKGWNFVWATFQNGGQPAAEWVGEEAHVGTWRGTNATPETCTTQNARAPGQDGKREKNSTRDPRSRFNIDSLPNDRKAVWRVS
ncbi:hypothetical protein GGTG_06296 [Gaeumannomyces tritici R3-111a-1]|uniref:Uncharacterized protein n=1 Tax=Gaeumannomyces tritici (strain R3-111a-1) TaxID=644352 RepID=J3NYE3_GAET3|nr:hypothetical protein GGTG_06296 [Gaeumannomyces tritici R3-111a-1]EJT76376.1 hypothetical protein GGTG_06296 [Gaeumannomyces tritici R3-111a-1]